MNNIFIEGIQGAGKTTLLNNIANAGLGFQTVREGDYSPVDLAWCAWLKKQEYKALIERYEQIKNEIEKNTVMYDEHFIVAYTKVQTDISGFYNDFEKYEIYGGRKAFSEFKDIVFSRYERFSETGYVFECAFFQNIVEDLMLFYQLSDDDIAEFYRELYSRIDKSKFRLLYLFSNSPRDNINAVKKERCDNFGNELWYQMLIKYFVDSPFGKKHNCTDFEDLISHLKHRQQLELRIIKEIIGSNALVLQSKNMNTEEITAFIK